MNETLRKLRGEIEKRGGVVHLEPNLPDEVAELFLREILDCPDCMAEARTAAQAEGGPREH